jgi:hypothetical protein
MARLALCREFLPDYAALNRSVRTKLDALFPKFQAGTHTGIHLEKINGARDPRARTIRIDKSWRGVVIAPETGDTHLLLRVLPHDDAIDWVTRHTFTVNQTTGALEIQDVARLAEARDRAATVATTDGGLFDDRADRDFTRLGIAGELVPVLRRIGSTDELLALTGVMPQGQGDALLLLADGLSTEEIWAQLVAGEDPGDVDPGDLVAALERPASQAMFRLIDSNHELRDILDRPFALWRVFLHPQQRRLAYRGTYNGSVRVTGGAGTGKTVVAMHRAKALAEHSVPGSNPILFTTFSRSLASAIEANLGHLGGDELQARVEVFNIDRLAHRIVREAEGSPPNVVKDDQERQLWRNVATEHSGRFAAPFLQQEWRQVIVAQGLDSRESYLAAKRPARGVRLSRRDRADVWTITEHFLDALRSTGQRTYLQVADDAARHLAQRLHPPYRHVIVDEAQDLHPAQWRLLRAAAPEQPNDLFIVGDAHQRIYGNWSTLSAVGINVRGRSHRLRINYRTTHEILAWSLGVLAGEQFDDLDAGPDTLDGYHSELHGGAPVLAGYDSTGDELDGLVGAVQQWIEDGVSPADIGVAARTKRSLEAALAHLSAAEIPARLLGLDDTVATMTAGGVELATMHRVKGLEYRCMAVIDAGADQLPSRGALTPEADDPIEHQRSLQRERCLLYVACTRARDALRVTWSGQPSPFIDA